MNIKKIIKGIITSFYCHIYGIEKKYPFSIGLNAKVVGGG